MPPTNEAVRFPAPGRAARNDVLFPECRPITPESHHTEVVVASALWEAVPHHEAVVRRAIAIAAEAVGGETPRGEVAVLLCDDAAMTELNGRWRGQTHATNVLSFPTAPGFEAGEPALGDIAVAYETVAREAAEQGKTVADHLAHLVVHGFLHLLGYDHDEDGNAEAMERLEREILARIGIADPYASSEAGI